MSPRPIIALLSDFGTNDWFVGSMKAAILSRAPECTIVDLCHSIAPGAIAPAAWILEKTYGGFPEKTAFCCVVDPGVGTERRAMAAEADGRFFIAPDNGLLTGVLEQGSSPRCRAITNTDWMSAAPSRTFHGRDIFAPAAAQVALAGDIRDAGERIDDPLSIELPGTRIAPDGAFEGCIVHFDRFGNAVTSLEKCVVDRAGAPDSPRIEVGHLTVPQISATYCDVGSGEPLAYWGSLATLEIAVRGGGASERLGLRIGARVRLI